MIQVDQRTINFQFEIATGSGPETATGHYFSPSALTNCCKAPLQIGLQSSRTIGTYFRNDRRGTRLGENNGRKLRERHFEFELGPEYAPCSPSLHFDRTV
jgi:hypothetical protein